MMLREAVEKIQVVGWQVLLEANPGDVRDGVGMKAYAWSDRNGYEFHITVPVSVYDPLDEDEVAVLERVIAQYRSHAA